MNYKSYADLSIDILSGISKIPSTVQLVVGIPRSGLIPAYIIGAQLNLPVLSLNEFLMESNYTMMGQRPLKFDMDIVTNILIVDDSVYSGTTIKKAKKELKGINSKYSFLFCAIYSSTKEAQYVDFYLKYLPQPRVFQWNYKNHFIISKSCCDIDGVLCVDPTDDQNDDGENYIKFLLDAKPLFIPSYFISCLVTTRLEKYRAETEAWLIKHQVNYGELIMLDLPSAKKRQELKIHARFKAEIYANRKEEFFIESNWAQAKEIFKITKKGVFCTQNDIFIKTYTDIVYYENALKYSNRYLNDIFSDTSEIGLKFQQLKIDYDRLEQKNKNLKLRVQNNKWVKFSNYNLKGKAHFLIKLIWEKIKLRFN